MLSSKSSARNCCSYWAPNSFLVKTGHTTVVIKLEGMLGARLVISPTVSLGLRPPRPNERQVLVRVLGAKVRDWAGGGGHLKFVDSLFHNCPSCLWNVSSSHLIWWKGSAGSSCIERARERGNKQAFCFFLSFRAAWKASRCTMPWFRFSPFAVWQLQRRDKALRLWDLYLTAESSGRPQEKRMPITCL